MGRQGSLPLLDTVDLQQTGKQKHIAAVKAERKPVRVHARVRLSLALVTPE